MAAKATEDILLKMYHLVSGNTGFSVDDVCDEFSKEVIDEPLMHNSRIYGKVPTKRHILDTDLEEKNIEELLAEVQ